MILYFADKNFKILGTASTSLSGGYVITDDTKKEEVETGIATLDCTVAYTDDTRADIESWCRAGNYVLAYYGKETAADMDIVNLFMITTTELSVLDHTIKFESEDSGLDLLNNLAKEYTGTEQMSAADYINKFLEKTGFRLRNNNVSKNPKKLEWTSTDTVTKRLADIAEKFEIELTYGFSVKGLTVSDRWVDIADETGRDTKINLYINKEVNNITVKNTIENLATALYATGKDNLTLIGFTIPEADKDKYQIDPDGNLVSLEALTKWARVDYSSKDSFSGNLYQKFESSDTASQADLYKMAKEKLDSISDIETNYEVDIADLPPGVGIGDRVNIVDDAGNTYISGRILELETSVTDGTKKATLGEYVIKDSGISELVESLASSFANLSKVRELYTWIAYADTIDGDGFSFSPEGKEYLGTAVNQLTEEAGTDPAVYKWVKTKGEQGEKGQTGAPGEKGDPGEDGYSPTVDLSTGESGSTMLTVTNKTGTSSTELKDQAARNDANDARNYADNYINYDETGTMIAAEAVKPIAASKNNVLLTDKDVQIRDGQKVLASYGETIDIGGESEQHVTIAKDKMAVNAGPESLFSVDSFKSGTEIISTWINTDKLTPTEDIYPEISDSIAFSVEDINRTIDLDGSYSYSYNYSFYNKGAKRVWFELEGGGTITINEAVGGNSLHYEEFSNSGNEYYNGFELATSEKITRKDIIALRASYDIEFNPAIVDIGQYRTKDVINYMGMNLYDFKALKIGSGIASENNRRDAFTVDFLGNGYFGNTLNVEQDIRAMYIGTAQVDANKIAAENISAENISADNITMNIQRGTGKITLTTGAVGFQPRWYRCGNIVQMEVSTKCAGEVASGANIAAGKITGVPKPITKSGVRAVSYYGNNSNISYMGSDGTFYARNAGADALKKNNDCIGGFTYITDGTML
jgi:phage minor structural protein|nr:MAG TPA: tail protein [Caudoviricetes sp.]